MLKIRLTWEKMSIGLLSWKTHACILLGTFSSIFLGMPSFLTFGVLAVVWGTLPGFVLTAIFQVFSTFVVLKFGAPIAFGWRYLEIELIDHPKTLGITARQLAFLPRLFIGMPLRTVDQMIAAAHIPDQSLLPVLALSAVGMTFRLGAESYWIITGLHLMIGFQLFPEDEIVKFLLCTALLIFSLIWPKIPEAIPGDDRSANFFKTVFETNAVSKPQGSTADKQPRVAFSGNP